MSVEPPVVRPADLICATRRAARSLVEAHPNVSPTGCVYIDCRAVEAMTSPFASELRLLWPCATPIGANEDVTRTWEALHG